ncbi:hypothetical protein J3P84_09935 [Pseudomonas sp. Z1-29]|uniref:hypothetical protein n=1 Tax=Pseudomonas sp. Z1-29 TaxID=2817410 RepID=UPI003DAA478C
MKFLILDDETGRAETWADTIRKFLVDGSEVKVFNRDEVSDVINEIQQKRIEARNGRFESVKALDGYDLVIIDYDLLGLDSSGGNAGWSTGAEIAYAARLMCDVGPLVVVNQYGNNSFDLTMKRSWFSKADLDMGSHQVVNPGAWKSNGFSGFRPWHWPNLQEEAARFSKMTDFVRERLDASIIKTFGFVLEDTSSPKYIGYELSGLLGIKDEDVTFRELLTTATDVRVFHILEKDLKILQAMDNDRLARVTANVVWRWLEKIVLPSQETLSDLPHLALELPWIFTGWRDSEQWNRLSDLTLTAELNPLAKEYAFVPDFMFSRPVYWGGMLKEKLVRPDDFDVSQIPNLVFCEDTSQFVCEEEATDFPSDLPAFEKQRWVKNGSPDFAIEVNYEPQSYLLM